MRKFFKPGFVSISSAMLALLAYGVSPASAQQYSRETVRGLTVVERPRPELDPTGMPLGGFRMFPNLGVVEEYDDNIFATDSNEVDDFTTKVQPEATIASQWSRHALNLRASGDFGFYADNTDENYEDYFAGADGRFDYNPRGYFSAGYDYRKSHEARGSPDNVNGIEPTEYDTNRARGGWFQKFNRLSFKAEEIWKRINFDDVLTSAGASINNDDRDRDELESSVRLGYEIVPEYEAFTRFAYFNRDYDNALDDNGFNRDSDGYEIVGGTALDFGGKLFGDVYVGYREQDFDDLALQKINGVTFGGEMNWNAGNLTTFTATVRRTIEETTQAAASGYFMTTAGIAVNHELRRNIMGGLGFSYTNQDYEGISRDDDLVNFSMNLDYQMNRLATTRLSYELTNRNSNIVGQDYTKNVVMVRLVLHR